MKTTYLVVFVTLNLYIYASANQEKKNEELFQDELKSHLLNSLGLKKEPKVEEKSKVIVPRDLLEKYLNERETMRESIPDDADFLGQLDREEVEEFYQPQSHMRSRRHAPLQASRTKDKKCNRRELIIDFHKLGWNNWIVAPSKYQAYYCAGDCTFPMSDNQNASNHAILQSIYHSVGRVVPRACCAPTKYNKVTMLYSVETQTLMKEYDHMVVEACGCQ